MKAPEPSARMLWPIVLAMALLLVAALGLGRELGLLPAWQGWGW